MSAEEEWRPVVGWEQLYEVSSFGRVRSLDRVTFYDGRWGVTERRFPPKLLKTSPNVGGYPTVGLCRDGRAQTKLVHILVCEAYHGLRPAGCEVAHGDGCRANPAATNLRWATPAGNYADRVDHDTLMEGERHPNAALTVEKVLAIRRAKGEVLSTTAARFGISVGHVWNIQNRRAWKHVPG